MTIGFLRYDITGLYTKRCVAPFSLYVHPVF